MAITGIIFIVVYVYEAIVVRVGEPDHSLLFWYLPILFLGILGMVIGLGVGAWGGSRVRVIRRQIPLSGTRSRELLRRTKPTRHLI